MDPRAESETTFDALDPSAADPNSPVSSIVLQIEIMGTLGGWWR